jgi:hypothetical protein
VVAAGVGHQLDRAAGDGAAAVRVLGESLAGRQLCAQGGPVQAEVGADAGVGGDAQPVFQEELIDEAHGQTPE